MQEIQTKVKCITISIERGMILEDRQKIYRRMVKDLAENLISNNMIKEESYFDETTNTVNYCLYVGPVGCKRIQLV